MPLKRCEGNGYKLGNSGKCYKGRSAKQKALKQMRAIKVSQNKRGNKKK